MMSTAQIKKPQVKQMSLLDISQEHNEEIQRENQRQALISKLNWHTRKTKGGSVSTKDITIAVNHSGGHKRTSFDIYFRNGVAELICEGTDKVSIAFIENRIYFMANEDGYKVSKAGNTNNPDRRTTRMTLSEDHSSFVGDYDLKYDSFLKLYFIEKEGKE